MGLDMYLNAKRFIWSKDQEPFVEGVPEDYLVKRIEIEVAYWRKANAIHQWFVDNVQNGEDDCDSYPVTREQLQDLLDKCKRVLEDRESAKDILPTTNGFFFGGTEYDEYYFQSIKDTIEQVWKALHQLPEDWAFEYQASW